MEFILALKEEFMVYTPKTFNSFFSKLGTMGLAMTLAT